ncbi:MAG: alpha/beta hydrolase [Chloroflexota bacterium]
MANEGSKSLGIDTAHILRRDERYQDDITMLARTNGVQLYYTDEGAGLPLVVHHGGPGFDHTSIAPFLRDLAGEMRLVCFDHRGTGRSSHPEEGDGYDIGDFVDDVEGLRRHLGVEGFAMLGHSFGGMVALHYVLAHPERLSHLLLVCTAASHEFLREGTENMRRGVGPEVWLELERIAQGPPSAENMKRAFMLQAPVFFRDPSMISALDLDNVRWGPASQAAWQYLARFDLRGWLCRIRVPTLVIAGRHDLAVPLCHSEEMAQLIPGAHLAVSESSAHFPYIEDRGWFLQTVRRFLLGEKEAP